jgi:hypothetical protein
MRFFNWLDTHGNKVLTVLCVALAALSGQGLMDARWAFVGLAVCNAIIDQSYRGAAPPPNLKEPSDALK